MTREEAIAYFKRHIEFYCVTGICREAEEMAIKALEQMPKWIPVSEKLPNLMEDVLVCDGVDMFIAWVSMNRKWHSSDERFEFDKYTSIKAWMPLPKPYEMKSENT